MKHFKKLVVILLGPPGAGKGTQAILLAEKLELFYFETSKILEEEFQKINLKKKIKINGKIYSIGEEKEKWERGELCSPPFVTFLVKEKIKTLFKKGKNLVLAGSPRTVFEAKKIIPLLEKYYGKRNIKIFLLNVSPKFSILRNSARKICELFRHPILYSKETKNLKTCPLDGSPLLKRGKLDDPETIKKRLLVYEKETLPILDYLKERDYQIFEIDGEAPPYKVYFSILKILNK